MTSKPWSTTTRLIVIVMVIALTILLIYEIRSLMPALIIASLIAYILNLFVRYLGKRTQLSRGWSVHLVYFIFILLIIAAPGTLVPLGVSQAKTFADEWLMIREEIDELASEPIDFVGITIPIDQLWEDVTSVSTDIDFTYGSAISVIETTSLGLIKIVIIIVVSYYLLKDWKQLRQWLINILPESGRGDAERLISDIDVLWRAYMQGTLALMLIMAVIFTIIGLAVGLEGAVAVGIFSGIVSMIPEIGPFIAGALAVVVAYIGGSTYLPLSNFWFAVLVAVIFAIVAQIKSIWLRPQVMGRFLRMNTGLVFFAILAGALLQGILGALIVLPILATARVLGRYVRAKLLNINPWPELAFVEVLTEEFSNMPLDIDEIEPKQVDVDRETTASGSSEIEST
ncbi:MAG: AI-2E family transporter [Anaerolineae bacterium]|nr:MAG: AI-2E family transporter [Anaerolineae bacterium]